MEIGKISGFRFWRYRVAGQIQLISWVSNQYWTPGTFVRSDQLPDFYEHGIHAFKTYEDLEFAVRNEPDSLVYRAQMTDCDGVVFGTVDLWGVVHEHKKGYRAEFAQPTSFSTTHGDHAHLALSELRQIYLTNT